ncbi:XRE family transcriptional regulator [Weissella confusa]|uniref:helix-turn-helix domain-containing protein n=1 Tax=Weissella confusa TaxID=1583 RepID=UPI0021BF0F94|nr:helix-turn-helix transcriptional regulator [Weissella confusa]MCT8394197.1 XRE family transcriptional regulator [Weissella confusa]
MDKTLVSTLRKQKNWTQEILADKSFVTVRTIQRLEAGEEVSLDTLQSVSNALSVTVSELFEYVDQEEREVSFMEFSKEQVNQLEQRESEFHVVTMLMLGLSILIMGVLGSLVLTTDNTIFLILGSIWIGLIFLIIGAITYYLNITLTNRLNIKYPLTVGVKKKPFEQKPITNGWEFLSQYWWIIFPIGGFLSWLIPALL